MAERLISRDELLELVPFTIHHIYRLERANKFPKRVRVGEHRVVWVLYETESYIAERMAACRCRLNIGAASGGA